MVMIITITNCNMTISYWRSGQLQIFTGLPGLERGALTMKSLSDAIRLRNHLIKNLEQADFECCPERRESLMTFVVAGGGFAGVETIAAINDFVREAIEFYPNLSERHVSVVLVEAAGAILPELGSKLGSYAQKKLEERGVEFRMHTAVNSLSELGVELAGGTFIKTKTVIWTAGVSPNPLS